MTNLRVSDDDRSAVVAALQWHTAAGRITLDEFSDRADLAYRAVTQSDLAVALRDLPARPAPAPPARHRELLWSFVIAAVVVLMLAVAFAFGR